MARRSVPLLVLATLLAVPAVARAEVTTAKTYDVLVDTLAAQMKKANSHRIAVADFSFLRDNDPAAGAHVAEQVLTGLVATGEFEVVERRLLMKVIEEQKISLNDLFDPKSVAAIGSFLGVDTIVSGTITARESDYVVNARAIRVDGAIIVAVGELETDAAGVGAARGRKWSHLEKAAACFGGAAVLGGTTGAVVAINEDHDGNIVGTMLALTVFAGSGTACFIAATACSAK